MAETVLGGVLEFFRELGVYDVILPFILVFTLMFAILERTRIFGTEKLKDVEYTKKNLNAMISFVVAFLVVASSKLVETITAISSKIIVLLMLVVFFLMLIGSFVGKEDIEKKGVGASIERAWQITFGVIIFIGIIFIFLDSITTEDGRTWLEILIDWLSQFYTNTAVAAIILIIVVILLVWWITKSPSEEEKPKGGSS